MEKKVSDLRHRLELVCSRMDGLSPLKKISGGYGFVTDADGKRVETVTGLQAGGYADRPSAGWTRGGRDPGGLSGKPAWVKKWFIVLRVNHNREI